MLNHWGWLDGGTTGVLEGSRTTAPEAIIVLVACTAGFPAKNL